MLCIKSYFKFIFLIQWNLLNRLRRLNMSKDTLYKLFYKNNKEHKAEFEKRFNSENSVHLDIMIGENQAFFEQTVELYKLITSIERTDKKVNTLTCDLPPVAISQYSMRCLIKEIMLTNDIEGVNSTRKEVDEALQSLYSNDKKKRFKGLAMKYVMLLKGIPISLSSCMDIRNIYNDIFLDEIKDSDPGDLPDGKIFRKNSVSVYSAAEKEIHHGLMPEEKIIKTMDSSLKILYDTNIDILFRIAIFHYLFGYIHPFYDGNGRTSRFISSYLLSKELNPLIGYRISYTIKENIKKYYDAFKICNHPNNKGDITPFLTMFLNVVDISEKQLCSTLEEKKEQWLFYDNAVHTLPNNDVPYVYRLYSLLIQAALFSDYGISIDELEKHLEISYSTVHKRLKLIPLAFIKTEKHQKLNYYKINLEEIDKYLSEHE